MPKHPILSSDELQALQSSQANSSELTDSSEQTPAGLSPEMKLIHELRHEMVLLTNRVAELEQKKLVEGQTQQRAQQEAYAPPADEVGGLTSRGEKFGHKPPLVKRIRNFYT